MADNSNGCHFKRGLDKDFMAKLKLESQGFGWFADVLADHDLILGIRDNYVNMYWHGQSLFKIERNGLKGSLKFSTHPKYLVNPDLYKPVSFDGSAFQVNGCELVNAEYAGPKTLGRMKRAAQLYRGDEKHGVHAIVRANPNVIDTEVAFSSEAEAEKSACVPRIDLACFEDVNGLIRLRFWEAKLYSNDEIRAEGDTEAQVVGQVRGYRGLIEKHRKDIVDSYREVSSNLVEMARWVTPQRKVGELVKRVADGASFTIDETAFVGLIIYQYVDAHKRSDRFKTEMKKLRRDALITVLCAGKASEIKLRGGNPD
jgi:hypothetical protein